MSATNIMKASIFCVWSPIAHSAGHAVYDASNATIEVMSVYRFCGWMTLLIGSKKIRTVAAKSAIWTR